MSCGCVPRIFRRTTSGFSPDDAFCSPQCTDSLPSLPSLSDDAESRREDVESSEASAKLSTPVETPNEQDKKTTSPDKARRHAAYFLRHFFKSYTSAVDEAPVVLVRCEWAIDEANRTVGLTLHPEEDISTQSKPSKTSPSTTALQSIFRIRGRKTRDESEFSDLIRARHPSSSSTKTDSGEEGETGKAKSGFCFGWGLTGQSGVLDEDEAILRSDGSLLTEAPPGLVGLRNLGNTCFLNAALQCLRSTPGFVTQLVPELNQGFEGMKGVRGQETGKPASSIVQISRRTLKRLRERAHSANALYPMPPEWDCPLALRSSSLPSPLPYEIGGRLEGETGLAGGSGLRLASVPNLTFEWDVPVGSPETKAVQTGEQSHQDRDYCETTSDEPSLNDPHPSSVAKNTESEITEDVKEEQKQEEEEEIELSEDFMTAFQKLVMEICLGEAEQHRTPKDLYLQLKKLPQGEWFCDGGQHDCQEILKVLLDAIHACCTDHVEERAKAVYGPCISDVSDSERDGLQEMQIEIFKANSLWKSYLSKNESPITDVFAGQLQTVRTCQKCHCRSTTYEPFWDLSLSLTREKASWFNPGRMPSCLDDLMRAFTAAELLQGEEAPYCDCCEQKSPATRRILIHKFPKVLVLNIKRFKYTKDGREKLTSNITFPLWSLQLQNYASKEHQHEGMSEIYDLYAVSNHYGRLGGGHYTAFCKVKDDGGKDGWYAFNDKAVTKISEDMVATPNAYILFYAKRSPASTSQ